MCDPPAPSGSSSWTADSELRLDIAETAMPDKTPDYALVRSPDIWFESGTHILRAGNTVFRVHGDLLSAASGVFRNMFTLVCSSEVHDTYDGCILIDITQETSEDMSLFLLAVYGLK